jgi:hypothetical protein
MAALYVPCVGMRAGQRAFVLYFFSFSFLPKKRSDVYSEFSRKDSPGFAILASILACQHPLVMKQFYTGHICKV